MDFVDYRTEVTDKGGHKVYRIPENSLDKMTKGK